MAGVLNGSVPTISHFTASGWRVASIAPDMASRFADGGALIVFYSRHLEASEELTRSHWARVIKPIIDFLDGLRFQFAEPKGNEFAF